MGPAMEEAGEDTGDCTGHSLSAEDSGGPSQLGFGGLKLSQSQDLEGDRTPANSADKEKQLQLADPPTSVPACSGPLREDSAGDLHTRHEVSSSKEVSDSRPWCQREASERSEVMPSSPRIPQSHEEITRKQVTACNLMERGRGGEDLPDQSSQDSEILSTQEDMFGQNNTTENGCPVTRVQRRGSLACTPADTLHLLHLSGQGSLAQENLSIGSLSQVAPSPDAFRSTPLILPSSPTEGGAEGDSGLFGRLRVLS
uniref:Uncharacterized protein n=1 Tax=Sphenodon punctatus TaxID=8508 RepID=A0A8D0HBA5_SPHPU